MRARAGEVDEWIDGFLFVANRPILDFLNTKPTLADGPVKLLPDAHGLERWLIASGMVTAAKTKSRLRSWRAAPQAAAFLKELIAFRERLRNAVVQIENGSLPSGLRSSGLPLILFQKLNHPGFASASCASSTFSTRVKKALAAGAA